MKSINLRKVLFDIKTAKDAAVSTISLFVFLSVISTILLCVVTVFQPSTGLWMIMIFLPSVFLGGFIIAFIISLFYYVRIVILMLMNEVWLITSLIIIAVVIHKLEAMEISLTIFFLFPLLWFEMLILIAKRKRIFIET